MHRHSTAKFSIKQQEQQSVYNNRTDGKVWNQKTKHQRDTKLCMLNDFCSTMFSCLDKGLRPHKYSFLASVLSDLHSQEIIEFAKISDINLLSKRFLHFLDSLQTSSSQYNGININTQFSFCCSVNAWITG